MSQRLEICEVGPRDGLQSQGTTLSIADRVQFVERLLQAGLTKIEVGSLVNPKLVPTMADSDQVFSTLATSHPESTANLSLLVPNAQGLAKAAEIGCRSVALFSATSETFNLKNINRTVKESISELEKLILVARGHGMHIRLYVSTVFDCAYEGTKNPVNDLRLFEQLFAQVDEVSLGDTTGKATANQLKTLLSSEILSTIAAKLWWHFHDTYQLAEQNADICMKAGYHKFDASAGGIGGCPFSPGAKGNISTEKIMAIAVRNDIACDVTLPLVLPQMITV
jgi:hydroxymethylglutaryl-CoA lyase